MAKYIQNKSVNSVNANNLIDFGGMGDAIWNFILVVYKAKWDSLFTNQKTNNLRSKISSKFTLRTPPTSSNKKKEIPKYVLVTINKALPLPPLPAKSKKEVNIISKYFQPKNSLVENKAQTSNDKRGKSYAQASKPSVNTSEVLKIKEIPSLDAKKID